MDYKEFQLKATQLALKRQTIKVKGLQLFLQLKELEVEEEQVERELDNYICNSIHQFEEAFPEMEVSMSSDFMISMKEKVNG